MPEQDRLAARADHLEERSGEQRPGRMVAIAREVVDVALGGEQHAVEPRVRGEGGEAFDARAIFGGGDGHGGLRTGADSASSPAGAGEGNSDAPDLPSPGGTGCEGCPDQARGVRESEGQPAEQPGHGSFHAAAPVHPEVDSRGGEHRTGPFSQESGTVPPEHAGRCQEVPHSVPIRASRLTDNLDAVLGAGREFGTGGLRTGSKPSGEALDAVPAHRPAGTRAGGGTGEARMRGRNAVVVTGSPRAQHEHGIAIHCRDHSTSGVTCHDQSRPCSASVSSAPAPTRGSFTSPGLQKQPGVEVVAVANRSRESGERAAREFGIPHRWRITGWEIVEDAAIDAVCIGTWPYLHAPVTIAALEEGKHVLCEARMAMNATQGHEMLDDGTGEPPSSHRPDRARAPYPRPRPRPSSR